MPYPFFRLNSSLCFSNHLAMLVISTSIKVVAWGAVRLVRTMCSAMASRMRLGVTSSSSSPALVGAGVAFAAAGAGDGCEAAGAVDGAAAGDGDVGAVAAGAGDGCGCEGRADT